MTNNIVLEPVKGKKVYVVPPVLPEQTYFKQVKENIYLVFSGQTSFKPVNGNMGNVTPISAIRFDRDITKELPNNSVFFKYGDGYKFDEKIYVFTSDLHLANVKNNRDGTLVFSTDSDKLINSYRVLQIVGALPSINGMEDVKFAQYVIANYDGYNGFHESQDNQIGLLSRLKSIIPLDYRIPNYFRKYSGKIGLENLVKILQSTPTDMSGNRLETGEKTNLVVDLSKQPKSITECLQPPAGLSKPTKYSLITDYEIIKGVNLFNLPTILSTTKVLNKDESLEKSCLMNSYYESLRDGQLKSLIAPQNGVNSELVLSPVKIKITINPEYNKKPKSKILSYPQGLVTYLQGFQTVTSSNNGFVVDQKILKSTFRYGNGINLFKPAENLYGVAHVAVFEQTINSYINWESSRNINHFSLHIYENTEFQALFHKYFRKSVDDEAERVQKEKGIKISGVVLSEIKVIYDNRGVFVTPQNNLEAVCRLAATYLV